MLSIENRLIKVSTNSAVIELLEQLGYSAESRRIA